MEPLPPQMDKTVVARRMKAARALAGYSNTKKLEEALEKRGDVKGLKVSNLNLMERGARDQLPQRDLEAIAIACDLPRTWFHVDDIGEAVRIRLPEVARLPSLTGELGRRVGGGRPSTEDRPPGESPPGQDGETGTDG